MSLPNLSAHIWSVADLLRGDYRRADNGKIILPFTILRRLDCVLSSSKAAVLDEIEKRKDSSIPHNVLLPRITGYSFYNTSKLDLAKILTDPNQVRQNLIAYINSFSENITDIFEKYEFVKVIDGLAANNLLYFIVKRYVEVDLHPDSVSNADMGLVFEELIRKFSEESNETAGEHFTPREVIRLMVNLLFDSDSDALSKPGTIRSLYDPTAGTGGMLSVAEEHLHSMNPGAKLIVYGQELNGESYAMCKSDMLIKGQDVANIIHGNTLSSDGLQGKTFDYGLANPPFGVEWTKVESEVKGEHEKLGFAGRFGPGLPRKNDGSFLFLLHLISKMSPVKYEGTEAVGGGRIAIVLNGSPLFTGSAGSGESDIRKWVLENDLLEAIIALPNDMFYNTGIATYIWVLSNHKPKERKGKVQLIDGSGFSQKMRKSLGSKRNELGEDDIATITRLYGSFSDSEHSKIFNTRDFGYSTITVERPLRLVFQVTKDKIEALSVNKAAMKLECLDAWIAALSAIPSEKQWTNREKFLSDLGKTLSTKLSASEAKILIGVFGDANEAGDVCLDKKGNPEPDADLRDTENVPLGENIDSYFDREVKPHTPDAWIDHSKTKVGYEIPFTRHFYKYVPPRSLDIIDAELDAVTKDILALLGSVTHGS